MPMFKKSMVLLLVIAVAAVFGTMVPLLGEEREPLNTVKPMPAEESSVVTVYVSGAVSKPGVITMKANDRVGAAVKRCGDVLPTADTTAINMAEKLSDGMHINVPEVKEGTVTVAQRAMAAPDRININRADEKELDKLPGIGPAMARRIIDYRKEKGAFESTEDLKKVRGIGDAKFDRLKDKITI